MNHIIVLYGLFFQLDPTFIANARLGKANMGLTISTGDIAASIHKLRIGKPQGGFGKQVHISEEIGYTFKDRENDEHFSNSSSSCLFIWGILYEFKTG